MVAVLDSPHALAHRARDRVRRIGMRLRVASERLGFLHRGGDFLQRELPAVQRIVGARDAARHHDLDLIGALAELLAHGAANRVGAVDDLEAKAHRIAALARAVAGIGAPAGIRMPARGADRAPGDEHPLNRSRPVCDAVAQTPNRRPPVSRTVVDRGRSSRGPGWRRGPSSSSAGSLRERGGSPPTASRERGSR